MSKERASTGIAGLDRAVDDLRIGDNVVWQVDSLAAFRRVLDPFIARARSDGRRIVYARFAGHDPLVDDTADIEVRRLDPELGFEAFAIAVHDLIAEAGHRAFYVFDSLSALLDVWHSDLMVMNLFKVTCPFLFELDTIAYFPLLRDRHSSATISGIRETTQLLLALHDIDGQLYVHPHKVDGRSSPTMFFPQAIDGDRATAVTSSEASARLFAARGVGRRRPDSWQVFVDQAFAALDADAAEQERVRRVLARVLVGPSGRMADLAARSLTLADLLMVAGRQLGTGRIGGKSVGMLVARAVLEQDASGRFDGILEPHDSFYLGADVFYTYLVANGWWSQRLRHNTSDGFLSAGAELHALLPGGDFPEFVLDSFRHMLEYYGQAPIIVRSSSLLEDGFGNAFAGKYDSFFLTNQGAPDERLRAFCDAVRATYASSLSDDALRYRLDRGLAAADEQMAILVQRVSGDHHGRRFFPHAAGVGNSTNLYVWDRDLDPHAGMVRLVFGLGTRAVDRTFSDHARLVALDRPMRSGLDDEQLAAHSQRLVDVLDLDAGVLTAIPIAQLLGSDVGAPWPLFASPDQAALRRLRERGRRPAALPQLLDFAGLLAGPLPGRLRAMLSALADAYAHPVDVEFTVNIAGGGDPRINLVQCRPLQTRGLGAAVAMPVEDPDAVLFASTGDFMGGNARLPLDYVVTVRPSAYIGLGRTERHDVARQLGVLNRKLAGTQFALIGPGRWGTTTESLGVPVRFAEISQAAVLVETTVADAGFLPELSYGSHFFLDLVEAGIFYCALFDHRPGVTVRLDRILDRPNLLTELDPDAVAADVVHVARGDGLELFSDVVTQRVVCLWLR